MHALLFDALEAPAFPPACIFLLFTLYDAVMVLPSAESVKVAVRLPPSPANVCASLPSAVSFCESCTVEPSFVL
jgi:hypothetical protein